MIQFNRSGESHWALILGGSSGFGLASAKKLAANGMNVFVVHRDRRGAMKNIQPEFDTIAADNDVSFVTLNINALTEEGRSEIIRQLKEKMKGGKVRMLLHSIAFGNLRPIAPHGNESEADIAVAKLSEKLGVTKEQVSDAVSSLLDEGVAPMHTLSTTDYGSNLLREEDMAETIYNMGTSFSVGFKMYLKMNCSQMMPGYLV